MILPLISIPLVCMLSCPGSSAGRALSYRTECCGFKFHLGQLFFPFSEKRVVLGAVELLDLDLPCYLVGFHMHGEGGCHSSTAHAQYRLSTCEICLSVVYHRV